MASPLLSGLPTSRTSGLQDSFTASAPTASLATGFCVTIVDMTTLPDGTKLKRIPISPNDDYRAGSDGQIYSRTKYVGFGKKVRTGWYPLTGHLTSKGYRSISLSHENVKVTKTVHRLVCMAFHGEPKADSMQVRHLDGNRENNRPENLQWGTQEENWSDRRAHGRAMDGERHHSAKFSDKERESIRWAVRVGLCSQRHASRVLGVAQASIQAICAGETSSG